MTDDTITVDCSSPCGRQLSDNALSPTLQWDENLYDESALLSSFAFDSFDISPSSPASPLYLVDGYALPSIEECDVDGGLPLSSLLADFDQRSRLDEFIALHSIPHVMDADKVYPQPMPWISAQGSIRQGAKKHEDVPFERLLDDEPLSDSPEALPASTEVTAHTDLNYSPFSWEDAKFSNNLLKHSKTNTPLSPAEEARLRTIAMPPQLYAASSVSSSPSPRSEGTRHRRHTSPESSESDCLCPRGRRPINKRKAHNVIEKRYRTNLVDRIAELRDSIPGLCSIDNNEDSQSCSTPPKLNKATILSKATEYIRALSKCSEDLKNENTALQVRINAFEMLYMTHYNSGSA